MRFFHSICAALLALQASGAAAQSYPERPVRIIVGFAPGGIADTSARVVANHLTETWGKAFIVENRPGASTISIMAAVKSPADGYTLLHTNTNIATNPAMYPDLPYDADRDLTPVALVVLTPGVLVVHPSVPVASIAELIALAKKQPGRITFASVGAGSFPHLATEMFKQLAGVELVHVPYKGFAPAMAAVLSNEVNLLVLDIGAAASQHKAGKLRGLAVSGSQRSRAMPELPTVAEAGLLDYEAVGWLGTMAPAGVPREIVVKLNAEINRGLARPENTTRFAGAEISPMSPEGFGTFIQRNRARWTKVIKTGGIGGE